MMNIPAFLTFVIITAFTPGPNNIMSMSLAGMYGINSSLRFILGVVSGFTIVMLLCGFCNMFLFNYISGLSGIAGYAGGGYMIYLALSLFMEGTGKENSGGGSRGFIAGMMLQFVNPKVIVYGLTSYSTFLSQYNKSAFYIVMFSVVLTCFGFCAMLAWALFGTVIQKIFSQHRGKLNIAMALLLLYSALSVSGILKRFF